MRITVWQSYLLFAVMTLVSCFFAWMAERGRDQTLTLWRWKVSKASLWLAASATPLILVSGMRWDTGIDQQNYFWAFMNIRDGLSTHVEIGYYWLNRLVLLFTQDLSVVFFLCAVFTGVFLTIAIRRSSSHFVLSTFLYITMGYFFYSMNSMRHFMALSVFLFTLKYIQQKKFWHFLPWILFAACFHKIALVAIPLYFIFNIKWKAYWYGIFAGVLFLLSIFHRQILDFIYQFVFGFYQAIEAESVGTSWVNVGITLALSVLCIYYQKKLLARNPANIVLMNAAWCGFLFFTFCGWIPDYTRIGQYCTMLALFLVPEIFHCEDRPLWKKIYWIGLITGFTLFILLILWNAQDPKIDLMPYSTVWQRTDYERWQSFWILPPQ